MRQHLPVPRDGGDGGLEGFLDLWRELWEEVQAGELLDCIDGNGEALQRFRRIVRIRDDVGVGMRAAVTVGEDDLEKPAWAGESSLADSLDTGAEDRAGEDDDAAGAGGEAADGVLQLAPATGVERDRHRDGVGEEESGSDGFGGERLVGGGNEVAPGVAGVTVVGIEGGSGERVVAAEGGWDARRSRRGWPR